MKKLILIIFFLSSCSFNNTGEYWNKKIVNEDSIDFNKDYTFDEYKIILKNYNTLTKYPNIN